MFQYKAIAFDLDDTLLRDDLTISDYTIQTLRSFAAQGVYILPASGRAKLSMKPFVDQMSCASMYISCNGAELWDGRTHALLRHSYFPAETGKAITAFGKKYHAYTQTYEGECFYYNEESLWAKRYAKSSMLKGVCVGDLEIFIREPRNKILMMDTPEKIAVMLADAQAVFKGRASVTCSKPYFLEFNPPEATKGRALIAAADLLCIQPEDFIAFGDSLNDLSMLRAAGCGILMENGREDLKPFAGGICATNQQDGVARYLNLLRKEEKL